MSYYDDLAALTPPKPEDFGLKDSDVKMSPDWVNDSGPSMAVSFGLIAAYLIFFSGWDWSGILLFLLFVGWIPAAILSGIYFAIVKWWKLRFGKGYAESKKLKEAEAKFSDQVEEILDNWLTELGVGHVRKLTIEEHHDQNLAIISSFGGILADVSEEQAVAANTSLLRLAKSTIKGAILDEIFSGLICENQLNIETLKTGLLHLAIFRETDRPVVLDPIAEIAAAGETAKRKGLDIPAESMIKAIAEATSDDRYQSIQKLQEEILEEQRQSLELLDELETVATKARELDEMRVWLYERYFKPIK